MMQKIGCTFTHFFHIIHYSAEGLLTYEPSRYAYYRIRIVCMYNQIATQTPSTLDKGY
jgi:hypothetical protein